MLFLENFMEIDERHLKIFAYKHQLDFCDADTTHLYKINGRPEYSNVDDTCRKIDNWEKCDKHKLINFIIRTLLNDDSVSIDSKYIEFRRGRQFRRRPEMLSGICDKSRFNEIYNTIKDVLYGNCKNTKIVNYCKSIGINDIKIFEVNTNQMIYEENIQKCIDVISSKDPIDSDLSYSIYDNARYSLKYVRMGYWFFRNYTIESDILFLLYHHQVDWYWALKFHQLKLETLLYNKYYFENDDCLLYMLKYQYCLLNNNRLKYPGKPRIGHVSFSEVDRKKFSDTVENILNKKIYKL